MMGKMTSFLSLRHAVPRPLIPSQITPIAGGTDVIEGLVSSRAGGRGSDPVLTVLDRPGLETRSCECYQVVRTEYDRLLG